MKVLVVEDSDRIRKSIVRMLSAEGFTVDSAVDGEEGLLMASVNEYDTLVLDLMLPKLDGLEVLRRLRRGKSSLPILILSARAETEQRIEGLQIGADDYLAKPFDLGELSARVQALVRRKYEQRSPVIEISGVSIDTTRRRVSTASGELELTASEYTVLEFLAMRRGHVVSKDWLLDQLVGTLSVTSSNVVEVYISGIRRKLKESGSDDIIETRRGLGYLIA